MSYNTQLTSLLSDVFNATLSRSSQITVSYTLLIPTCKCIFFNVSHYKLATRLSQLKIEPYTYFPSLTNETAVSTEIDLIDYSTETKSLLTETPHRL